MSYPSHGSGMLYRYVGTQKPDWTASEPENDFPNLTTLHNRSPFLFCFQRVRYNLVCKKDTFYKQLSP
jgi:hypothetical protein